MNAPQLPASPWVASKHATPAYAPQFGIYADSDAPQFRDFIIVKGGEEIARAVTALPGVLKALEPFASFFNGDMAGVGDGTCVAPSFTVKQFKDARAALIEAGYTF